MHHLGRQQLKSTLPSLVVGGGRISDNEGTTSFLRETALPREARKFGGTSEFLEREGIRIRAKRGNFLTQTMLFPLGNKLVPYPLVPPKISFVVGGGKAPGDGKVDFNC